MKQKIVDDVTLGKGYRIDKELLTKLGEIIEIYNPNVEINIIAYCKKISYSFSSLEEFFIEAERFTELINRLTFSAKFPKKDDLYNSNSIILDFRNKDYEIFKSSVTYSFDDEKDYYALKNKIEQLLNNYKLVYSFFTYIPFMSIFGIIGFTFIYHYTRQNNIIFPYFVQYLITIICIAMLISPILPPMHWLNSYFLPACEFRFGVNNNLYDKMHIVRSIVGVTIGLGIVVGVIVNLISHVLLN